MLDKSPLRVTVLLDNEREHWGNIEKRRKEKSYAMLYDYSIIIIRAVTNAIVTIG